MWDGQRILKEYYQKEYNKGRQEVLNWLAEEHPEIAAQYISSKFPTLKETKVILSVAKLYEGGVPESHALPIIMKMLGTLKDTEKEHLQNVIKELRDSGHLYSFKHMKREYKPYWLKITPLGEKYLNECDETQIR